MKIADGLYSSALLIAFLSCGDAGLRYTIVKEIPHDTAAFTQGLLHHDGSLYESTGLLGRSELRRLDPVTGAVEASVPLPTDRFGEGIALLDERLYQLTWKSEVAYVYDVSTLALLDSLSYDTEGWGLTTDGTSLIMGDGSSTLRVLDPTATQSFATAGMADRPDSLAGKRVGLLSNDKLNSEELLDAIYDVLAERFDVASSHSFNKGDASRPADPDVLSDFSGEVDVALLANGD